MTSVTNNLLGLYPAEQGFSPRLSPPRPLVIDVCGHIDPLVHHLTYAITDEHEISIRGIFDARRA